MAVTATICPAAEKRPPAGAPIAREEVEVRLSTLEAFVVDRDGLPMYGLEASDFEVLQDGQPVEITAFEAPRRPSALAPGGHEAGFRPAPSRGGEALNLVFCVDATFLVTGDLARLVEPVRTFLHLTLGPGDRAMVLDCHNNPEPRVALTTSADSVADGLDDMARELRTTRLASEYRSILQELEQVQGRGSPRLAPMNREAAPQFFKARIDVFSEQAGQELQSAAQRLSRAVLSVEGLPGRTELFYVSGRPPQSAAPALYEAWKNAFGSTSGYTESNRATPGAELADEGVGMVEFDAASVGPIESGSLDPYNDAAMQAALRGVRIHSLEAGGLVNPAALITTQAGGDTSLAGSGSSFSTSLDADQGMADREVLSEVAKITGGESLVALGDATPELTRLSGLLGATYIFAFPAMPAPGKGFHEPELRLTAKHAKASLRYRRLYRQRSLDEMAGAQAVSALLLGLGDNPLEVRLTARPAQRTSRRRIEVPLSVGLPFSGLALVAQGRAHTGSLSIFLVHSGTDGRPSPVQKAVVPVRVENSDLLTSLGRRVEYSVDFVVPSDTRRIAVGVRDDVAGSTSTAFLDIAPEPKSGDRRPGRTEG